MSIFSAKRGVSIYLSVNWLDFSKRYCRFVRNEGHCQPQFAWKPTHLPLAPSFLFFEVNGRPITCEMAFASISP